MVLFYSLSRFLPVLNFLGVPQEAAMGFVREEVEQPQNAKVNIVMLLDADKNECKNRPKKQESLCVTAQIVAWC